MKTIIGSNFPKEVKPLIENAKKTIDVIVFDWRWYSHDPAHPVQLFNQCFVRAARRGVLVRVLLNNNSILPTLVSLGIKAKCPNIEGLVHSKMIIIDEKDLVIGSHNFTQSAFTNNLEVSTYLSNYEEVDKLLKLFNNLYNLHG